MDIRKERIRERYIKKERMRKRERIVIGCIFSVGSKMSSAATFARSHAFRTKIGVVSVSVSVSVYITVSVDHYSHATQDKNRRYIREEPRNAKYT
jgi:hypothetical protein